MFIITDKSSVVIGVTEKVVYADSGNVGLNEVYFFSKDMVGSVVEVTSVPTDYEPDKYKYIDSKFQVVEGWKERTEHMTIDELQRMVKTQNEAIAELTMFLVTG